jgi:deoxyxylulose-5-phosphate synthase
MEPDIAARHFGERGDVTIMSYSSGLAAALEVQNQLQGEAIAARVVDLRSLRPLDGARLEAEARRSGAVVVVDPPGAPPLADAIARRCGGMARCVGVASLELSEIVAAARALCVRRPS